MPNTITMPQAVQPAVQPPVAEAPAGVVPSGVPTAVVTPAVPQPEITPTAVVTPAEVTPIGATPTSAVEEPDAEVHTDNQQEATADPLPPVGNVVTKVALALIQVDTRMYGGDDVDIYIDGSYVTCSNGDTILLNKNEAESLSYLLEHVILVEDVDIAVSVNPK